jgi:hypothetical protein
MLIALAAELNLELHHLDVKTAFLNGELDERIFMNQQKGFIHLGEEKKVCLLKKVYGLKQASRQCSRQIHGVLLELELQQSNFEPCVYFKVSFKSILL